MKHARRYGGWTLVILVMSLFVFGGWHTALHVLEGIGVALLIPLALAVFAATFVLCSPVYAHYSAEAFEKKGMLTLIQFVYRRPNRFMHRMNGRRPMDFMGLLPRGKVKKNSKKPERNFFGYTDENPAEGEDGHIPVNNPKYWELVESDTPFDPYQIHSPLVRLWVWYINRFHDVDLVGLRGFYKLYGHELKKVRYEQKSDHSGDWWKMPFDIIQPPKRGEPPEMTYHVRLAPFEWPVYIPIIRTKDGVAWTMLVLLNIKSINGWITLHNHADWSQFLNSATLDVLGRKFRDLKTDDVLSLVKRQAKEGDDARDLLIKPIDELEGRLKSTVGYVFDRSASLADSKYSGGIQILFVGPNLETEEDKIAFLHAWRAGRDVLAADNEAKITRKRGDAEAYAESAVVDKVAQTALKHKGMGEHVVTMQALERVGEKGNTMVFRNGGTGQADNSSTDELLTLVLKEMRNLNGNLKNRNSNTRGGGRT